LLSLALGSLEEAIVESMMNQEKLILAMNTILRCLGTTGNEMV
jgi:hypothetical protein